MAAIDSSASLCVVAILQDCRFPDPNNVLSPRELARRHSTHPNGINMNLRTLKLLPALLIAAAAGFGSSAHAAGAIITPGANACRPLHTGDGKKLEFDEFGAVRNKSADFFVDLVCSIPVSVGPDGLIVGVTGTSPTNKPIPLCDASAIGDTKHSELFPMPPQGGRFNTTVVFAVASGEISRYDRVVSFCRLNPFSRIEAFSAEEINF